MTVLPLRASEPPRLIVNITAGTLTADALERYAAKFEDGGLRKLLDEGAVFTNAAYDCMQTLTPVSLATLSTGAQPEIHGVISDKWYDHTTGQPTDLTEDSHSADFERRESRFGHSPRQLTTPTISDLLMRADSSSRILSLALTPRSSIVQNGRRGFCFWLDSDRCRWTTSTYYTPVLPNWVKSYNAEDLHARFLTGEWVAKHNRANYANSRSTLLFAENNTPQKGKKPTAAATSDFIKVSRTPIGNTLLFDFAKYAVKCLNMGNDEHPDILNICLDTAENIARRYGTESVEFEDMIYRLDSDLREFLAYLNVHLKGSQSLVVVFTAAHGSAPAADIDGKPHDRFNPAQFGVIMNAYLNARYGAGAWVRGYSDRSLYLNRDLIDERHLTLTEVQNTAAAFALRFRGVAHALSAWQLQSGYFGEGYGGKMQRSFYPRRSGDVVIDLMPEWTEECDDTITLSGSFYAYDTRVPLIFCGTGIAAQRRDENVSMTSVAPTIARLLGIEIPAADGKPLDL